jgi:hypothetical protein
MALVASFPREYMLNASDAAQAAGHAAGGPGASHAPRLQEGWIAVPVRRIG